MAKRRSRGEGSVFRRRDGRWVASLDLGYIDGKRKRLTFYGQTRREALEKLEAAKAQLLRGELPTRAHETVGQFLSRWLEEISHHRVAPRVQVERPRGQGLVLSELKTRQSQRPLPLPRIVVEALRRQGVRVAELRVAAVPHWEEHGLVFPSRVGTPLDPRRVSHASEQLREQIGLPWLSFHGPRHGLAALLAAGDVHPGVAQEMLRPTAFSLMIEVYTAVAPELQCDAAETVDRILEACLATHWLHDDTLREPTRRGSLRLC